MFAKRLFAGLMALLSYVAFGVTYEFKNKAAAVHYFDNPNEWQIYNPKEYDVLPQAGHTVQMASLGVDGIVYVTNDVSTAFTRVEFVGGSRDETSGSMRFIGTNAVFTLTEDSSTGDCSTIPVYFRVMDNGVPYSIIDVYSNGVPGSAQMCMKNADFTLRNSNGVSYVRFDAGDYSFGSSSGGVGGGKIQFGTSNGGDSVISFEDGVSLNGHNAAVSRSGTSLELNRATSRFTGLVSVNGGSSMFVNGGSLSANLLALYGKRAVFMEEAEVVVTDDLYLYGGVFSNCAANVSVSGSSTIAGGGTLDVSGGTFTLKGGDGINLGTAANTSGAIEVSGGTSVVSRVRMGRSNSDTGDTLLRQTGGLLRLHDGGWGGILFLYSCTKHGGTQTVELNGGVSEFRFIKCDVGPGIGNRRFFADGGTLCPTESTGGFFYGMDEARIGEKGLVLDTSGYDVTIDQALSNKVGVSGFLRKTGVGEATYKGDYSVSRTVVDGGTLRIGDADTVFATELLVTNGATFSMAGDAEKIVLKSLAITNATVVLDPGDVIEVSGAVSCSRLRVEWTALPEAAVPFLVVAGEMDEQVRREISNALFSNVLEDGTHAAFEFAYDESTGKTTVKAKVAADAPIPESSTVAWTGSGKWGTPANWEGNAVPTGSQRAAFVSATAGKEVDVDPGATVGAIRLAGDGYLLKGEGPLEFAGEAGSVRIDVESGSHEMSVPVELPAALAVSSAAGSSLELSGGVSHGGIAKSGTGRLVLSAPSAVDGNVTSSDGMVTVRDEDALGDSGDSAVILGGGTVEFSSSDGSAMRIRPDIFVSAPETNDLVVFKTDTDVTVESFSVTKGAFVKRGEGTLTMEVAADVIPVLALDAGNTEEYSSAFSEGGLEFPEDGTVPVCESKYPGFGIAEGEVIIKSAAPGAKARMSALAVVGVPAKECAVQPSLTVDGVDLDCSESPWRFFVGSSLGEAGVNSASLRILNGGSIYISGSQIGYGSTKSDARVYISATNGAFRIKGRTNTYISRMYGTNGAKAVYRFKDSSLLVDPAQLWIGGGIDLEFVNSVWSTPEGGVVSFHGESARPNGVMFFRDGSVFASLTLSEHASMNRDLVIAFDDAEWLYSRTRSTCTIPASTTGHSIYEMRGRGVIFAPAEGAVYTVNAKLEGEGGMVKRGEGTVKFGSGAYAFSGVCDIEGGIVDLSDAGEVSAKVKGPGIVTGAEFAALTIVSDIDGSGAVGGAVTLDGCTLPSRVTVDFGRDEDDAIAQLHSGLQVARFTGEAPDVSGWVVKGGGCVGSSGYRVGGRFRVSGDAVLVDLVPKGGFSVIIR